MSFGTRECCSLSRDGKRYTWAPTYGAHTIGVLRLRSAASYVQHLLPCVPHRGARSYARDPQRKSPPPMLAMVAATATSMSAKPSGRARDAVRMGVVATPRSSSFPIRRSSGRQRRDLLGRALALLERRPAGPERDRRELKLQIARGVALIAAEGYGAASVIAAYDRAWSLSQRLDAEVQSPRA
jgi:hypothetical protein